MDFNVEFDLFGEGKPDRSLRGPVEEEVRSRFDLAEGVATPVAGIFSDKEVCSQSPAGCPSLTAGDTEWATPARSFIVEGPSTRTST